MLCVPRSELLFPRSECFVPRSAYAVAHCRYLLSTDSILCMTIWGMERRAKYGVAKLVHMDDGLDTVVHGQGGCCCFGRRGALPSHHLLSDLGTRLPLPALG